MRGESPPLDLKARASAWLELDPGLSSDEVRPALWQRLAATHFLPDPVTHEAISILAGRQVGSAPALELAIPPAESRLRGAVEEFASHFFDIPVADRRDHWEAFRRAAAASPTVQERLARLAPGLTLDPGPEPTDPRVRRLAGEILTLFPTPAAIRPAWLREFAYRLDGDPDFKRSARRRALKTLTRHYPTIARLGPEYRARVRPVSGLARLSLSVPRQSWINPLVQSIDRGFENQFNRLSHFYHRLINHNDHSSKKQSWLAIFGYLLIMLLGLSLFFAFLDLDRSRTPILPLLLNPFEPR